jgi:hypothetical protein
MNEIDMNDEDRGTETHKYSIDISVIVQRINEEEQYI